MLSIVCRRDTLGLTWSSASREEDRYRFITINIIKSLTLYS